MVIYAPSPIAECLDAVTKRQNYKDLSMSWWENNSMFKHNSLLLSYGSTPDMDIREKLKIPESTILIGDSGGFKILNMRAKNKKCNINALDVLKWQEKNCDIGLTLDISPTSLRAPKSSSEKSTAATYGESISDKEYYKRLEETCKNNEIFKNNRDLNSKLKIYNVVHGASYENLDKMETWYEKVKDYKFDGWAIAPKPAGNPLKIAVELGFMYDRGIKSNTHVFAVFGRTALPILAYVEKKMNYTNISTDSFAQSLLTIYRQHNIYYGPSLTYSNKDIVHTKVPCLCPVCCNIDNVKDMFRTDNIGYGLLYLHNTWVTLTYLKYLEALVEDEKLFKTFANKISILKRAVDFIDDTIDYGWEEAVFKSGLKQKSIMNW